jgi:hypothetical protein
MEKFFNNEEILGKQLVERIDRKIRVNGLTLKERIAGLDVNKRMSDFLGMRPTY